MNLPRTIIAIAMGEFRMRWTASGREIRYQKYRIASQGHDRIVRERLLQRLPKKLRSALGTLK